LVLAQGQLQHPWKSREFSRVSNDTVVTDSCPSTLMLRHLRGDPDIGIVGPVTDNIGNEARIEIDYPDLDSMQDAARRFTLAHLAQTVEVQTLAFFCLTLRRRTYEDCGSRCADYGIGSFEDYDCRRVQTQGLRMRCAEAVFVHHHLSASASFSKLAPAMRDELSKRNQAVYNEKWGPWIPHHYRNVIILKR
jgi:GT2 family glycosyltransferase